MEVTLSCTIAAHLAMQLGAVQVALHKTGVQLHRLVQVAQGLGVGKSGAGAGRRRLQRVASCYIDGVCRDGEEGLHGR